MTVFVFIIRGLGAWFGCVGSCVDFGGDGLVFLCFVVVGGFAFMLQCWCLVCRFLYRHCFFADFLSSIFVLCGPRRELV